VSKNITYRFLKEFDATQTDVSCTLSQPPLSERSMCTFILVQKIKSVALLGTSAYQRYLWP
jgi:hypothetical protein